VKLDTRWLDWQPSDEKFGKSPGPEPTKTSKSISDVFVGADSAKNQNFFSLEAVPGAYEDGFCRWLREQCTFVDRAWWGIGALHRDYFAWCERTGADVPGQLATFKILLRESGFTITDDNLVYGLALTENFQKDVGHEPSKITKKTGRRQ
jgi:hypothetical protein